MQPSCSRSLVYLPFLRLSLLRPPSVWSAIYFIMLNLPRRWNPVQLLATRYQLFIAVCRSWVLSLPSAPLRVLSSSLALLSIFSARPLCDSIKIFNSPSRKIIFREPKIQTIFLFSLFLVRLYKLFHVLTSKDRFWNYNERGDLFFSAILRVPFRQTLVYNRNQGSFVS